MLEDLSHYMFAKVIPNDEQSYLTLVKEYEDDYIVACISNAGLNNTNQVRVTFLRKDSSMR